MKNLRLTKLSLLNFKGKSITIDFGGQNTNIYGDNATGKTTIYDGICWLLFDKNSNFDSKFDLKNLDSSGNPVHNLEHTVEGKFDVSGKTITLKKIFSEIWKKKRGTQNKEFSGHETTYYVNEVPAGKGEYILKVSEIATEEQFRMLTSPFYFSENMKWTDRRKILVDICGDVTDEDVISEDPAMNVLLPVIQSGRTISDHKKTVLAEKAGANRDIERIPIRIDEVVRSMVAVSAEDVETANNLITEKTTELEGLQEKLNTLKNGGEVAELTRELSLAQAKLVTIETRERQDINKTILSIQSRIMEKKTRLDAIDRTAKQNIAARQEIQTRKEKLVSEIGTLKNEWMKTNATTFTSSICPTCGQDLPIHQIETAKKSFNEKKSLELEDINKKGLDLHEQIKKLETEDQSLEKALFDLSEENFKILPTLDADHAEISKLEKADLSLEYLEQKELVDEYAARLGKAKEGNSGSELIPAIHKSIEDARIAISGARLVIGQAEQNLNAEKRKEELEAEEKRLAVTWERLEEELHAIELFDRTKVSLLEGSINKRFQMARFKLFADQINGGLQECCEVTYNGVPFSTGLNNGAKINVGLDIINTLSQHYQVRCPVFIDNAESVTQLIDMENQIIRLVVSPFDAELRVERIADAEMKEAA